MPQKLAADLARASLNPFWVRAKMSQLSHYPSTMYPHLEACSVGDANPTGMPGAYTRPGATYSLKGFPDDAATADAFVIAGDPATAWTTGQWIHSGAGPIYWDGANWQDGVAP